VVVCRLLQVGKKKQAVLELGGGGDQGLTGSLEQAQGNTSEQQPQRAKAAKDSNTASGNQPGSQAEAQAKGGKASAQATAKQQQKQESSKQVESAGDQMQVDVLGRGAMSDDDSDLLVVRRKDVFADGESEQQVDAAAEQQDLEAGKRAGSKKRLKIKVSTW
jgi:co-chaperonin GroES (HSP10)